MENVVENSKGFIKAQFPEVDIIEESSHIIFEGRFILKAKHDDFEICEAPRLKIVMSKEYPKYLPVCYDVERKVKYDHVFSDSSLCVATNIDLANGLKESKSIEDYINKFIVPYFLSYRYWEKTGQDLYGDRSHGVRGIWECVCEYLGTDEIKIEELKYLLCWASKTKKFRKCIPQEYQKKFLYRYWPYIKKLRKLGVLNLRKEYHSLMDCLDPKGTMPSILYYAKSLT